MMRLRPLMPLVLLLALILAGCAKKRPPAPAPTPEPARTEPAPPPPPAPEAAPTPSLIEANPLEGSLEDVNAYVREQGLVGDIYFDFDRSQIKEEYVSRLQQNAAFMREHPQFVFMIEGHCDERDTIEYNLALGQRRASVTQSYLVDLGGSPDRLQTISYGKEQPVCTESNEECWRRNRRAHFVISERR